MNNTKTYSYPHFMWWLIMMSIMNAEDRKLQTQSTVSIKPIGDNKIVNLIWTIFRD